MNGFEKYAARQGAEFLARRMLGTMGRRGCRRVGVNALGRVAAKAVPVINVVSLAFDVLAAASLLLEATTQLRRPRYYDKTRGRA